MTMDTRYIRQVRLAGFGPEGQAKLARAKVLVVGAGGLGIPVLQYLNAMGVGELGLMDGDVVEESNLHRQVIYKESDVGAFKVKVAASWLQAQNPRTSLKVHSHSLTRENALETLETYDLIIDATDNFAARYLINDACVILNKPFIYGALHGFEGQVGVFNFRGGPTYRCLYPDMPGAHEMPDCNTYGVLGILPGIVGSFQALEAIKVLSGIGEVLSGTLLLYDGLTQQVRKIKFSPNPKEQERKQLEPVYGGACTDRASEITVEDFLRLREKQAVYLIDVRSREEFESGHLSGAVNLPLPQLEQGLSGILPDVPIYLVCQSGLRSRRAMELVRNAQPDRTVFHLAGGMDKLPPL